MKYKSVTVKRKSKLPIPHFFLSLVYTPIGNDGIQNRNGYIDSPPAPKVLVKRQPLQYNH